MTSDTPDQPQDVAVTQLEALGLSSYAARTFVALVRTGEGTARDVSEASTVPRTRVYDAIDELQTRGLVDVQPSTPKRFWAISAETTGRHFEREYSHRVDTLVESLDSIETPPTATEQHGVWTATGQNTVTERVLEFIETASDEIVYMTIGDLLTKEITTHLQAADKRGISVKLAGMSDPIEEVIRDEVPDARTFESLWDWEETPAGRLLLADRERCLVSVLVPGSGGSGGSPQEETAIWGTGEANGLVVVLKAMFTWNLDARPPE